MPWKTFIVVIGGLLVGCAGPVVEEQQSIAVSAASAYPDFADTMVAALVGRLDLGRYKATIEALTQFGDRLAGTARNQRAVEWIDAQLRSYGCPTERMQFVVDQSPTTPAEALQAGAEPPPAEVIASGEIRRSVGGSRLRGITRPMAPNDDPAAQPDETLRALNAQEVAPGPSEQVYCTKVGTTRPDEMYIVGAHLDGRGFGEGADDNASGTALVMELARVFSGPDVETERSIRFALWNDEEGGSFGARAYVEQRGALQGREAPAGSGAYPEPTWLGMIQHDMMLFDHGMPRADGSLGSTQRPEADVNIEFQSSAELGDEAMALAFFFLDANERYATDYPAAVGSHMTSTDSDVFMDIVPAISLRENERGMHVEAGWNPNWHQATDLFVTYADEDFRLGLNAAQTTLGAVAELAGVRLRE